MVEESDCEIEYLDEDEDVVQQCVQNVSNTVIESGTFVKREIVKSELTDIEEQITPLLVERKPKEQQKSKVTKRKRKSVRNDDSDSDYDPLKDLPSLKYVHHEKFDNEKRKRKVPKLESKSEPKLKPPVKLPQIQKSVRKSQKQMPYDVKFRKNFDIWIPDYEDPLCLPVKAIQKDVYEGRKLVHWNNMCLEHLKHCDKVLQIEEGGTVSSKRTFVLRNVKNKFTGRIDTTIWGKTTAVNRTGEQKSEVFQSVLPRFRENKLVSYYGLVNSKPRAFTQSSEVILTKETHKNEDVLVVYKAKDAVSAVYKFAERDTCDYVNESQLDKRSLKEVTVCRVCAPCYQTSWRGFTRNDKKSIRCQICNRTFVSVYNLLSHLKAHHSHGDVRKHSRFISKALAGVVNYHYKCRICQHEFSGIRELRRHVNTHCGTEQFTCEIGNHPAI